MSKCPTIETVGCGFFLPARLLFPRFFRFFFSGGMVMRAGMIGLPRIERIVCLVAKNPHVKWILQQVTQSPQGVFFSRGPTQTSNLSPGGSGRPADRVERRGCTALGFWGGVTLSGPALVVVLGHELIAGVRGFDLAPTDLLSGLQRSNPRIPAFQVVLAPPSSPQVPVSLYRMGSPASIDPLPPPGPPRSARGCPIYYRNRRMNTNNFLINIF